MNTIHLESWMKQERVKDPIKVDHIKIFRAEWMRQNSISIGYRKSPSGNDHLFWWHEGSLAQNRREAIVTLGDYDGHSPQREIIMTKREQWSSNKHRYKLKTTNLREAGLQYREARLPIVQTIIEDLDLRLCEAIRECGGLIYLSAHRDFHLDAGVTAIAAFPDRGSLSIFRGVLACRDRK